jgi:hypothetical protein
MTATKQTGIEQHREHIAFQRQHLAELRTAGADAKVIADAQRRLNVAESELETWEADLERSPIDAHVVALDVTEYFSIADEHAPFIERIRSVYLFDRNERTHCCELTPSHYLIHLYDQVILTDAGDELDDYAKDDIYQTYEYCGSEDIYVHCHVLDRIIAKADRGNHYHDGIVNAPYADTTHDEQMEALREHFCGNHYV